MPTVLDDIVAGVRVDLLARRRRTSPDELSARVEREPPAAPLLPRLRASASVSVIAEVKRSSPSKGALARIGDPAALAAEYAAGGAAAISVLTEERRFGGSLADLEAVRARVAADVPDPSKSLAGRGAPVRKTRSILVVTCGLLVGGLRLLEDSEPDDGIMETVVAEPKSRFELILQLGRLVTRRDARGPNVDVIRSRTNVVVECPRGTVAQIDGDPVGAGRELICECLPGKLLVRVPR